MSQSEPQWLGVMRSLEGTHFTHGGLGQRDVIYNWLDFVGNQYPEMAQYCHSAKHNQPPYFAWCGLTVAYCMARSQVRPVFGENDIGRFLWAHAWLHWGTGVPHSENGHLEPSPGDVVVFRLDGGEHVTMFVREVANPAGERLWECLGGNQGASHLVKLSTFHSSSALGVRRPPAAQSAQHFPPPPEESWNAGNGSVHDASHQGAEYIPSEFILLAQASQRKWGVPASVSLAQAIVESNAGRRMPPNSFNPFGIKAVGNNKGVRSPTHEEAAGVVHTETASFRVFSSFADAFDKHGELLARHYPEAMRFKDEPLKFIQNLRRYATASNYAPALRNAINRYNLLQYDIADNAGGVVMEDDVLSLGSTGPQVKALQDALTNLNYWLGEVDGEFGPLTQQALLSFQAENDLPIDGQAKPEVWQALKTARPRSLPKKRLEATPKDLKDGGSRIVSFGDNTKLTGLFALILGALGLGNSVAVNSSGFGQTPNIPGVSPEVAQTVSKVLETLKAVTANPGNASTSTQTTEIHNNLQALLNHIGSGATPPPQISTVFDFIANNPQFSGALRTTLEALAGIAGSIIPGFGGSILALALGIAARYFGSKITQARTEDHNTGKQLAPLRSTDR